jgi:hypothetical protein
MRAGVSAGPSPGPGASSHCACIVGAVSAASGLVLVPNPSAPKPNGGTTRLSELFKLIALNEEWSPRFPSRYMQLPASYTPGVAPADRPPPLSVILPPATVPPSASDNSMIANILYKGNLFDRFKAMNLKTRDVLESANTRANPQPLASDGTTRMCLSYHLKGLCNGRCGRRADHDRHSDQQDQKLKEWANAHYKVPEGTE